MDLGDIAALLTAGGVGGAVAKWIGDTGLRRQARSDLLAAYYAVEALRVGDKVQVMADTVSRFQQVALIAGLPKTEHDLYHRATLARLQAGRKKRDVERDPAEGLDMIFRAHVATAAAVSEWLWHPWLSRRRRRRALAHVPALLDQSPGLFKMTVDPRAIPPESYEV